MPPLQRVPAASASMVSVAAATPVNTRGKMASAQQLAIILSSISLFRYSCNDCLGHPTLRYHQCNRWPAERGRGYRCAHSHAISKHLSVRQTSIGSVLHTPPSCPPGDRRHWDINTSLPAASTGLASSSFLSKLSSCHLDPSPLRLPFCSESTPTFT